MPATVNEVFAGRDVWMWNQPWVSTNTFPANNPWGFDWTTTTPPWVNAGWTKDGVAVRWRQQIQEYMVDQFLDPLTALPLSRDLRFMANIGQIDWPNMVIATSSGSATGVIPPATGNADYILDGTIQNLYFTSFFDIRNPITNDFGHLVAWRTRGIGDIEIRVHLPDLAMVNVEMRAFPDFSTTPARICQFRLNFTFH